MSVQFKDGPDCIIHLDAQGKPRSVEINGFEIPGLVAFSYEVAVGEVDRLSVTFYIRKAETRMDRANGDLMLEFDGRADDAPQCDAGSDPR